jgi:hypothetical protein
MLERIHARFPWIPVAGCGGLIVCGLAILMLVLLPVFVRP